MRSTKHQGMGMRAAKYEGMSIRTVRTTACACVCCLHAYADAACMLMRMLACFLRACCCCCWDARNAACSSEICSSSPVTYL